MDTTKEIPIIFPLSSQGRLNRSTAFIYPAVERFLSTRFFLLAFVYYSIFQSEFFPKEQSVEKKANFLLYMIYGYLQKFKKKFRNIAEFSSYDSFYFWNILHRNQSRKPIIL